MRDFSPLLASRKNVDVKVQTGLLNDDSANRLSMRNSQPTINKTIDEHASSNKNKKQVAT